MSIIIPIDGIDTIEIHDVFDIIWIPDSNYNELELIGGENNLNFVQYSFEDNSMLIEDENQCNFFRNYKDRNQLVFRSGSINHWIIPGSVNFGMTDTLHCDSLTISFFGGINTVHLLVNSFKTNISLNGGTGKYILEGNSNLFYVYFFGNGVLEAQNFTNHQLYLRHKTTGDLRINPSQLLSVYMEGRGDVFYYSPIEEILIKNQLSDAGELIGLID